MNKVAENSGVFDKGTPKPAKSGRKKGVPNKTTQEIKDMILGALDEVGGQSYFVAQSIENPNAFMSLVGKILPKQVDANINLSVDFASELKALELAAKLAKHGD
jgi:hypothetical protein